MNPSSNRRLQPIRPTEDSEVEVDVSVIICTCNRWERLQATLQALERVRVPAGLIWEVIVVDNGSADKTATALPEFSAGSQLHLRCFREPTPGKCRALNRGLGVAGGDLIAFLDDDTLPDGGWLEAFWKEYQEDDQLGVVAVRAELADPRDLPLMIVTDTVRKVAANYGEVGSHFGGWSILRRQVIEQTGQFDTDLGPGTRFPASEDVEYHYRIWKAGWKMLYAPAAVLYHNHGRRTEAARRALLRGYNLGSGAFYAKLLAQGDWEGARFLLRVLQWRLRQAFQRDGLGASWRSSVWLLWGFTQYLGMRGWRRFVHPGLGGLPQVKGAADSGAGQP